MLEALYQALAPWLPAAALVISVLSFREARRNRTNQREVLVLGKKTEIVTLLAQRLSKLGQLELIYAQKILLIRAQPAGADDPDERTRVNSNLKLLQKERKNCEWQLFKVRTIPLSDLQALESLLATATEFLSHVAGELEKEQRVFNELREQLSNKGT